MSPRSLLFAVAAVTFVVGLSGLDARATYGARVTADEPQYLLTAISLGEDFDLDIRDELDDERYLPFHEIPVNQQTIDLNEGGQRLSPHDPLLPALLAIPMRIGGWVAAKVAMALIAAATAAATAWVAIRRLRVEPRVAAVVTAACFCAPPLVAYATQVYPAMPAALAVVVGFGAVTGSLRPVGVIATITAVVALPWLSVKYAPLAAVLAVWLLVRLWLVRPRLAMAIGGVLSAAGAAYLALHRGIYGGWTVYAAGDHFTGGEFEVVGRSPNYAGRTRRVVGLLVDRGFGLIAWNPAYIAAVPALAFWARGRRGHHVLALCLAAASWAVATWVALTMHGWWWPGRQVVPVVPILVIALADLADRSRRLAMTIVGASVAATTSWLWLAIEASTDRRTLIVDFEQTAAPVYRLTRLLLPDHRAMDTIDVVLTWSWIFVLVGLAAWAWSAARQPASRMPSPATTRR